MIDQNTSWAIFAGQRYESPGAELLQCTLRLVELSRDSNQSLFVFYTHHILHLNIAAIPDQNIERFIRSKSTERFRANHPMWERERGSQGDKVGQYPIRAGHCQIEKLYEHLPMIASPFL
jgi:hypothetical protein